MNKFYPFVIVLFVSVFVVGYPVQETKADDYGFGSDSSFTPQATENKISRDLSSEFKKGEFRKGIVRIISKNRVGTGFIVKITSNKVYIITAAHVIQEYDSFPTVEIFKRKEFTGEIEYTEKSFNPDRGLALLTIENKNISNDVSALHLSKKCLNDLNHSLETRSDEVTFTYGFPWGGVRWGYTELTYSGRKGREIVFTGAINEGNSGGPIIQGNEVIGIITAANRYVYATSSLAIREFVQGIIFVEPELKHQTTSIIPKISAENNQREKVKPPTNTEFPYLKNILIFNACKLKSAHKTLAEFMRMDFPNVLIDTQYNWLYRYEMEKTRIYFLSPLYKTFANRLENWFPGKQEIIDYHNQSRMVGINEKRNIVIFLGNDYREVLSVFMK